MAKKKKTSIMLTDQDKKLLELLTKIENRSQTKEMEYLIRRRAEELELKIEGHNYYNYSEKTLDNRSKSIYNKDDRNK